jgi:putative transposase
MSRTVNGEVLFDAVACEVLRKMIWKVADFSGVEVVTYAVMKNHFHVLVRVPAGVAVSDGELMRRYRVLYPRKNAYQQLTAEALERLLARGGVEAEQERERLLARMHDVSEYMKTLKQRFTVWYNQRSGRYGTLWSERFKSVLVEGEAEPLRTMAAYIDLNAVRAGVVEDPKDYRFCGYAEAVAGVKRARAGLSRVLGRADLSGYRQMLFGVGSGKTSPGKQALERERAVRVIEEEGGKLPLATLLRCRVRYLSDGAVLGTRAFVSEMGARFSGEDTGKSARTPHTMRGGGWGGLCVLKSPKRQVFS